jgi:hypothetical protein
MLTVNDAVPKRNPMTAARLNIIKFLKIANLPSLGNSGLFIYLT